MLVFLALGKAKVLYFASGDAKVPNANVFASQWNIGLSVHQTVAIVVISTCKEMPLKCPPDVVFPKSIMT